MELPFPYPCRLFLLLSIWWLSVFDQSLVGAYCHGCITWKRRVINRNDDKQITTSLHGRLPDPTPSSHAEIEKKTIITKVTQFGVGALLFFSKQAVANAADEGTSSSSSWARSQQQPLLRSDEVLVELRGTYLGLGLVELKYNNNFRVMVQSVKADAEENAQKLVKPNMILVSVNGANLEGKSLVDVAAIMKNAERPLQLVLRDSQLFFMRLNSSSPIGNEVEYAETSVVDGILRVEKIEKGPGLCLRSAAIGDVAEVSYQVRLTSADGPVVDGVDSVAPAGAPPSDTSYYFVVGARKTPSAFALTATPATSSTDGGSGGAATAATVAAAAAAGAGSGASSSLGAALPLGWDVGVRGMCVGERRRIFLPPSLAFGNAGLKAMSYTSVSGRRLANGIPPKTALVVDVRLLSLNGVQ